MTEHEDTDLIQRLRHDLGRLPVDGASPWSAISIGRRRRRNSRALTGLASALLAVAVIVPAAMLSGLRGSGSSTPGVSSANVAWPPVIHSSHPPVSRAFSKACPIQRATLHVPPKAVVHMPPKAVVPGSTVAISGPVYYRDEAGRFVWYKNEHPRADYQAWWGLNPKNYASVAPQALSIAFGRPYEPTGSGPQMLGDDVPNGACSFALRFTVPDVASGTYPVSILTIGGRGSTAYSWFTVNVSNATSP